MTETAILGDGAGAAAMLGGLRRSGIRIALNDFGAGFSSMSHLRDLPLDRLKIDRFFVASAPSHPRSVAVIAAMTQLCRGPGIEVLGEGVETDAMLALLRELGCDAVQGYLLGRPARPVPGASAGAGPGPAGLAVQARRVA